MPGGMWDTKNFVMNGKIVKNGRVIKAVPLSYAGQPSSFSLPLEISETGSYEVVISAFEPRNGNTGSGRISFVVK